MSPKLLPRFSLFLTLAALLHLCTPSTRHLQPACLLIHLGLADDNAMKDNRGGRQMRKMHANECQDENQISLASNVIKRTAAFFEIMERGRENAQNKELQSRTAGLKPPQQLRAGIYITNNWLFGFKQHFPETPVHSQAEESMVD
ncbi:hypothetical protein LIA77_04546 [Sarocladium implicatum]|nr:hypothetical protein LIA77_04546 [Sarocladium implicatum]